MQLSQSLSFMRANSLRRATPAAIRAVRIVSVVDGFQLRATLQGSKEEWTLTSPGGLVDTFGDLPGLRQFAAVVFGHTHLSIN